MLHGIGKLLLALGAGAALAAAAGEPAGAAARMWNPATVATVSGTVEAVERVEMGDGWRCVRVRLRTAEGGLIVRVGPDWYLTERRVKFVPGEPLRVKGSRVTFAGEPSLVAAWIAQGEVMIVLRDEAGVPAWSGK